MMTRPFRLARATVQAPLSRAPPEKDNVAEMKPAEPTPSPFRLPGIDVARGAALVAMAVYHFTWDLSFFGLIALDPVASPPWAWFARSIAASFLFLVGVSLVLATQRGVDPRRQGLRIARIAGAAALITLATLIAFPEGTIYFGILHHIAAASLIGLALLRLPGAMLVALAGAAFALPAAFSHPIFSNPALLWTGLSPAPPRSNDFVPLLPWLGWTLLGIAAGRRLLGWEKTRDVLARGPTALPARMLAGAGRHGLAFYLLHQPILIGLVWTAVQTGIARPSPATGADFAGSCTAQCIATGGEPAPCARACSCIVEDLAGSPLLANRLAPLSADEERRLAEAVARCRVSP